MFSYAFCAFIWESELFFVFLFSFFPAGTGRSGRVGTLPTFRLWGPSLSHCQVISSPDAGSNLFEEDSHYWDIFVGTKHQIVCNKSWAKNKPISQHGHKRHQAEEEEAPQRQPRTDRWEHHLSRLQNKLHGLEVSLQVCCKCGARWENTHVFFVLQERRFLQKEVHVSQ